MDDLFIQAANGDKAAFTRIYESVYKQIYYVSYYSLANSKEAASAVSARFIRRMRIFPPAKARRSSDFCC